MNKVNFTLNGMKVQANAGQTVLEACRDNGVVIPTLCHDDRLKPFGSCLLCRVEIDGQKGNPLACGTKIADGMNVRTETDAIKQSRKMDLELLLSQHLGDCKAPCSQTCPANVDIQGYIAHIADGQYDEAIKLIKEKNPLPLVCGRICTRPCEDECRRNMVDERVGIDYLKRFVADYDIKSEQPYMPDCKPATGKKAAVIGAGPAGLSCAFYLAKEGHEVTIFERWPAPGGMLRYGIPEYRLPKAELDKEVALIEKMGVKIVYNCTFGKDITAESLKLAGYGAIFLGVGSQKGTSLGCEGDDNEKVLTGVEFLGEIGLGQGMDLTGKKVLIVGGGNVAIDACRSALRLGSEDVHVSYRRTRAEMPAHDMEIEEAEFEGVQFHYLINPNRIIRRNDDQVDVEFICMELGEPDASGRRKPVPKAGSEFVETYDYVIAAIGQTQDLSFISDHFAVASERKRILVDEKLNITNVNGVFAGGDVVTGPKTAIQAIAAGRVAANSMNQYLMGYPMLPLPEVYNHTKGKLSEMNKADFAHFEKKTKQKMPMLDKKQREHNFKEVELGFTEEQAREEAKRCLSCGCKDVNECKLRAYATTYGAKQDAYAGMIDKHPIDDSHPFLIRDANKCILCGRCIRICHELQGAGAVGFINRGYVAEVAPSFSQPFGEEASCENCGQCVSSCPVGALTERVKLTQPGPWVENQTQSVCTYCGTGCAITLNTVGKKLVRTTSQVGVGVNNGNLCKRGRFANNFLNAEERIVKPMVKKNGTLAEVTWEEAYATIKAGMTKDIAVYASARMANEEYIKLADLAKKAFDTEKLSSYGASAAALGLKNSFGAARSTATYEDIKTADVIAVLGFDIKAKNPIAALMVKQAAEAGAKLEIVCFDNTKLDVLADTKYKVESEKLQLFADEVYAVLKGEKKSEWATKLAEQLKAAKKPLLIVADNVCHRAVSAVANIAIALGHVDNGVLFMHGKANSQGQIDYFLGTPQCHCHDVYKAESYFIYGEDPVGCRVEGSKAELEAAKFVVVSDLFLTETAKLADVVLPYASAFEINGTFTNSEGRVQTLNKALCAPFGKTNKDIMDEIAEIYGVELACGCTDEVRMKECGARKVQEVICTETGCGCNNATNLYADVLELKIRG